MRVLVVVSAVAGLLALPGSSVAFAQSGQMRTGTTRPVRTAAMPAPTERAAPAAEPGPRDRDRRDQRRDEQSDDHRGHHRREARYVVLGDATVLADLGHGYEQVIRSCAARAASLAASGTPGAAPNPNQHAAPNPNAQPIPNQPAPYQPPVYTPPVYTPPAYSPPTTPTAGSQGTATCWTTDRDGRIVIVQP